MFKGAKLFCQLEPGMLVLCNIHHDDLYHASVCFISSVEIIKAQNPIDDNIKITWVEIYWSEDKICHKNLTAKRYNIFSIDSLTIALDES